MTLIDYLAEHDANYEPERTLIGETAHTPGYHTTLPDGSWVHSTRSNLDYALACLMAGTPDRVSRAHCVIDAVLVHQDTDPYAGTYGIWPWFTDEPLPQMAPPDWNWADFCGADLAAILSHHTGRLDLEVVDRTRAALGHAGWSIFRRNVQPSYTNIAIMGACVTLAAGELLDEPRLLAYGRRRLARFCEHTREHGGFNEYNSPTYTMVALHESERILDLAADGAARNDAEWLRRECWSTIAEHFHPGTGQWAGPHSRCYSDLLPAGTAAWLAAQTGVPIGGHGPAETAFSLVPALPCPHEHVSRFAALPHAQTTVVRRFIRREPDEQSTRGTTWLSASACLGSVNHDTLWVQRRPLLGYWQTAGEPAVLRLRCLRDGKDFASGAVWTAQDGPRTLSLLGFVPHQGDHHCHLDRPADGIFHASRLTFALELTAEGAKVEVAEGGWILSAAGTQAVVLPLPGELNWVASAEDGLVRCEAVVFEGEERGFGWDVMAGVAAAFGIEVQASGDAVPEERPEGGGTAAGWGAVRVART